MRPRLVLFTILLLETLASHLQAQQRIVILSLGDSYASGEGVPDERAEGCSPPSIGAFLAAGFLTPAQLALFTRIRCDKNAVWRANEGFPENQHDDRCHRSGFAGSQVAAREFAAANPAVRIDFRLLACSGAFVENIHQLGDAGPFGGTRVVPRQLDQVRAVLAELGVARVDALVIAIGGNDVGFAPAVRKCLMNVPVVGDCTLSESELDSRKQMLLDRYASLSDSIVAVLPRMVGNIFFTEYPDPTMKTVDETCGGPTNPPDLFALLSVDEVEWAKESVIPRLNGAVEEFARSNQSLRRGWRFVGGIADPFRQGHGYCVTDGRWLNLAGDAVGLQGQYLGAMHANIAGQRVYADALDKEFAQLIAPHAPRILARGEVTPKLTRHRVTDKDLEINWEHSGDRVLRFQVAVLPDPRDFAHEPGTPPVLPGSTGESMTMMVDGVEPNQTLVDAAGNATGWRIDWGVKDQRGYRQNGVGAFFFGVRACTAVSCSEWSNIGWLDNRTPPSPARLRLTGTGEGRMTVAWDAPTTPDAALIATYELAHASGGSPDFNIISVPAASPASFDITGLSATSQRVFVRSCGPYICAPWTEGFGVSLAIRPDRVREVRTFRRRGSTYARWTAAARADKYELIVERANTPSRTYHVPGSETEQLLTGTVQELQRSIRAVAIRACNDAGCSGWTRNPEETVIVPPHRERLPQNDRVGRVDLQRLPFTRIVPASEGPAATLPPKGINP